MLPSTQAEKAWLKYILGWFFYSTTFSLSRNKKFVHAWSPVANTCKQTIDLASETPSQALSAYISNMWMRLHEVKETIFDFLALLRLSTFKCIKMKRGDTGRRGESKGHPESNEMGGSKDRTQTLDAMRSMTRGGSSRDGRSLSS